MKNYIYSTLVLFFIGFNAFGQTPSWSVNENDFQYTMSFVAFVNVDGINLSDSNDKVAAFVKGECRGVTNLTYVASEDSYYAYLTVFSNENNETLNFKIYDSVNDVVKEVAKTESFEINEHNGNLFQALSIANPALSSNAEILDFGFNGVIINDMSISGTQITLDINKSENITDLNAIFELSSGAQLYIGTENQISDGNSIDFSNPVQFQVLSEDQSVLKQWKVTVNLSAGIATYYKKDAVCYQGGVLKVVFTENNLEAVLSKDGSTYATQTIHNGEAIFSDLEVGTYNVKVGGNVKEITINLKE
ncbi:hypothetical protein [Lutibacter flavus]|uniref:Por secretion system C-terminal sorting domain-containing protein n=1 Tax=Lutibacter flavus TaxID=691689 RepID=A0A238YLZ7_9FLAO|nr:hypothetical protein [Lutibacter flavus]SNR71643.1 hypothetical protein SAMN04488111_2668 [Lutibacter flavus]